MDKEQLKKGNKLKERIEEVENKLDRCKKALIKVDGNDINFHCHLTIGNVKNIFQGRTAKVDVDISHEQMSCALILAEKKIQKELDQLTQEFRDL